MSYMDDPSCLLAPGAFLVVCATLQATRAVRLAQPRSDRLMSIDGLRGILAFCVFLHHFAISYQWKHTGLWEAPKSHFYALLGGGSVDLFFMITGFLFFGKIKAVRGDVDLNAFFVGRVFRLVPVYAVSTLLVVGLVLLKTGRFDRPTLQAALDQMVLFQPGIISGYASTPYVNAGITWTLAYEWLFYFAVPVVCYAWPLLRLRSWVVFAGGVLALWFARPELQPPVTNFAYGLFAPFLLGGLIGEIGRSSLARQIAVGPRGALISFGALGLFYALCESSFSVTAFVMLAVAFAPIAWGNAIFGTLKSRVILFLGEISYDVYLLHGVVLYATYSLAMPNALETASTSGRLFSLMLIASAGTMLLSIAVHRLVERPCLTLGRRLILIDRTQELAAP